MLLALRKYREQESETPSVFKSLADGPPRTFLPAADILRVKCTVRRGMHEAREEPGPARRRSQQNSVLLPLNGPDLVIDKFGNYTLDTL